MKPNLYLCVALIAATTLSSCAMTSSKRRVVTLSAPQPTQTTNIGYDSPEAGAACETKAMRHRALDDDATNDIASITTVREVHPGTRVLTDVDVNCRDYFAHQLNSSAETNTIVREIATAPIPVPVVRTTVESRKLAYRVRKGDTLYGIARRHCTGWKTLARDNGLSDPSTLQPGYILRLPEGSC